MISIHSIHSIHAAPELLRRAAGSLVAGLLALLVPKCPLCVAAYLAGLGLGAAASRDAAPFVRPVAYTIAGLAALALVLALLRRRRGCCRPAR